MSELPIGSQLKALASQKKKENKKLLQKLKKWQNRDIISKIHDLHYEVFEEIDCLDCANCCKTLGPRITERDIQTMSKYIGIKPNQLIEQYLRIDEDMDYVFKSMPCPFLQPDNYCQIYEARPKACREYPHTDSPKINSLLNLSLKNTETCPAVFEIFERLK